MIFIKNDLNTCTSIC